MARLNYHHLRYFWQVASEGNLGKTAKNLHISQSALSSQIRQLEDTMGVQLFDREGRRLTLTDAGRRVLTYANDIFSKGNELESLLNLGIGTESQLLRIGMLTSLSRNFMDRLIAPLLTRPDVGFSLHADSLEGLLDRLAKHQLDVALTNADVRGGDEQIWQSQLLARQPVSIVGPPTDAPLSEFPEGYESARWVLPTRDHEIRRAFEGLCTRWQITPDIQAEANDMAMLRLLARDSGALAVLPAVVVRDEIRQRLLVEYMTLPGISANFYAITVRRTYQPPVLEELLSTFASEALTDDHQKGATL
jgi:LysR family transcriptional activator of nhaA